MSKKKVAFANRAIDVLGGSQAVADIFNCDCRVVSNWRKRGFPRSADRVIPPMLAPFGIDAPPEMFGMRTRNFPRFINGGAKGRRI
jgi:hypothetical protein